MTVGTRGNMAWLAILPLGWDRSIVWSQRSIVSEKEKENPKKNS